MKPITTITTPESRSTHAWKERDMSNRPARRNRTYDSTTAVLTRTRRVMDADLARSDEGLVCYSMRPEDGERDQPIYLHRTTVNELGNPTTITVTVEPGDALNPAEVPGPADGGDLPC